jgi:predicted XRE-type DNA-binding protein
MEERAEHVEPSSGNVLADLRLSDAVELAIKIRLACEINRLIKHQRIARKAAAARLQVTQPKISALMNYRLDGFAVERLMSFLLALGRDIEIRITPHRVAGARGRIIVRAT